MLRTSSTIAIVLAAGLASTGAFAQDTVKIGIVMPLTGGLGPVGKQVTAAAKLYVAQHGATVAGKKIELIIKDDAGVPDNSRRLAQELIVNDKVGLHRLRHHAELARHGAARDAGQGRDRHHGLRHLDRHRALALFRAHELHARPAVLDHRDWAAKNGSKKVVIVQSDWAPGAEATAVFTEFFTKAGGQVVETIKVPLANPDFAPFLQRARDANPDTLFVFVPAGQAGTFAKQFLERGLDKAGIKLIGPGDVTDDDDLPGMGDAILGTVTAGHYSA